MGPGVYRESVKIDKLIATKEKPVLIRAAVPRASFLVGSVTVTGWEKAPGTRLTYRAPLLRPTRLVYERNTNREYIEKADLYQVDETTASFMYDETERRLYVHTSDDAEPGRRLIEACVHRMGFDLWSGGPANWHISLRKHLIIEGFVLAGYSTTAIHIMRGDSCEIRNCVAHHCGAGFFMHSSIRSAIRNCQASWCYDRNDNEGGGIAFRGRNFDDVIENCVVHDVVKYGIRHYGVGDGDAIRGCLAYRIGRCAIHTKGRLDPTRRYADRFKLPPSNRPMIVERNVAVERARSASFSALFDCYGMRNNTVGSLRGSNYRRSSRPDDPTAPATQLHFDPAKIEDARFADPVHHDYRLQSDSPHRGRNLGAFEYKGDVFFVKPDGNDAAAGTSIAMAWRDASKAIERLKPGQTLYLLPGRYFVHANVRLAAGEPIVIRGHGKGEVVLDGTQRTMVHRGPRHGIAIVGTGTVMIERIRFTRYAGAPLTALRGARLEVRQCVFDSNASGLDVRGSVRVEKSVFHANRIGALLERANGVPSEIYGCIFWKNETAVAAKRAPLSNFNNFGGGRTAKLGEDACPDLAAWQKASGQDCRSISADPQFVNPKAGDFRLKETSPCLGRGYLWSPIGADPTPHHWFESARDLSFEDVRVSLATPTTANLTWRTRGGKSTALVRYGPSKEKLDKRIVRVADLHLDNFHAVTLFDLKPLTTYYFQVGSAPYRRMFTHMLGEPTDPSPPVWDGDIHSFTTPAAFIPKRRTFYVSKSKGDDANEGLSPAKAFRSVHRASRVAEPGDKVIVAAGEYFGLLRPIHSGLPDAPVIFAAAPGEYVELSGKRLTQARSAVILDKRHIRLRGFAFKEHSKMLQDDVGIGSQLIIGDCRDVRVEDCLFDGRMYYMASVRTFRSRDVHFTNNAFYIKSNWTGLIIGMNPGPIVFDHNTFYSAATSFGHVMNNDDVRFTNNIFGEKMRVKWAQPKLNLFDNRKLTADYNYHAFNDKNKHRFIFRLQPKPDTPYIQCRGKDALGLARKHGLETHGRVGPLPWAKAAEIARKSARIRGIEPSRQNYGRLELSDFAIRPDAPCRGMASDRGDPGRRER